MRQISALPPLQQSVSTDDFKFSGLDEDDEFPEIYVPESDPEEKELEGDVVSSTLANTSAWSCELVGDAGVSRAYAESEAGVSIGAMDVGMWVEAKSEKSAQELREAERQAEVWFG